jgi:prophage regulatory protein
MKRWTTLWATFSFVLACTAMRRNALSVCRVPSIVIASTDLGVCRNRGIAMLPFIGNIEMRILSKRQLKELVLYSPQHVSRLEKAGLFPKRVHLGPSRVGWVEAEVLDWLQQRLANRDMPSRHS